MTGKEMPPKIDSSEYDVIVFDLDGTIYPLGNLNKTIFFLMNISNFSLFNAHRKVISELRGKDFGSSESFYNRLFSSISNRTGKNKETVSSWYFNIFYRNFEIFLKKHCHVRKNFSEVVNFLRSSGVKTAILSDYGKISERLEALGIDNKLFDVIFSAEKYGVLKPEPRTLSLIIDFFGADPDRVLMVGDKKETDGMCAKNCKTGFYHIDGEIAWDDFCYEIMGEKIFKNNKASGV
jgi:HAD superfamily hydrolase (TIGR01549 family)